MRALTLLSTAILLTFVAACGTSKYDKDPLYDAGFSDGCATGTARTPGTPPSKAVRDDKLWDISDAYKAGWRAGYNSCSPSSRNDL